MSWRNFLTKVLAGAFLLLAGAQPMAQADQATNQTIAITWSPSAAEVDSADDLGYTAQCQRPSPVEE